MDIHGPEEVRHASRRLMLSQRAPFCIGAMAKKGMLSQHFVTHVVPPLYTDTESEESRVEMN